MEKMEYADIHKVRGFVYAYQHRLYRQVKKEGNVRTVDHGLRGSASPVLTATGFVNGRWQFSTPTESTPLDRAPKNLLLVITSATPTAVPNLVQIRPRGASGQTGEI